MKITNEQLRRIIKEEIEAVFQEGGGIDGKYERRPFAATDGPMPGFGEKTGNLRLINFGIKKGLPQDHVIIKLSEIENNFRNALTSAPIDEEQVNRYMETYKRNMTDMNPSLMTGDAWRDGLVPALVKKLGPDWDTILDKNLLWKRLVDMRVLYTGKGKGAPTSIEQFISGPDGAHIRGDETTKGNRVTVDDPTME